MGAGGGCEAAMTAKIKRGSGAERRVMFEVVTVREFTYLGDRMGAGGGCEAAANTRTACGLVKFRECCELLYG